MDGDNDYKAGSQWEVAWTYSLKETTYVSNMVSLVSGDFNSDGVDDIAATWGYYTALKIIRAVRQ